jgi:subtilisin family serine protease
VPDLAEDRDGEPRWGVAAVSAVLMRLREVGIAAEPNHVMLASQGVKGSPVGTEAHFAAGMMFTADTRDSAKGPALLSTSEPAPQPNFLRTRLGLARVPHVLVLDTGLRTIRGAGTAVEHAALVDSVDLDGGWTPDPKPEAIDDEDEADDDGTGFLDFEAGHGTFISGIVRQICPDAVVHIGGVLSSFGDGDVLSIAQRLEANIRSIAPDVVDVVIMSFGGYMTDDDGTIFGRALRRLLGPAIGIAAAGNQSTSRPYFPAACEGIVGVGALGEDGRAWFSNFGGWVDACAPGIDIVSTFFEDYQERVDGETGRTYRGWARWSGTSFAAPKVAAAVAQEMHLTDCTARQAWTRLSNYQRYRYPDLGTVFNV